MASSNSEQPTKRGFLPRPRGWVVILAAFTFGATYLYHLYREQQDIFINTYYFRTLQEVATEFNNNLDQLVSLHKYNESDSTILSIFASYQKDDTDTTGEQGQCPAEQAESSVGSEPESDEGSDTDKAESKEGPEADDTTTAKGGDGNSCKPDAATAAQSVSYSLGANRVKITRHNGDIYHVAMEDLMPAPRNDFVLYVIANEENRVLSSSGGSSGLSLIDTKQVSKAIQLRENQDWLKLAAREGQPEPDPEAPLPGYSTRIDVDLTTGTSRLFILPFHLHHKVAVSAGAGPDGAGKRNEGAPLYLVGIQPENVINSTENKRWNLSLLLLSLAALVFLWSVTRLLMISPHQPLGAGFYYTTLAASYLTFLMLVALLMSLGQRDGELATKQVDARDIIRHVQTGLERDLYAIFEALEHYHPFYARLLDPDLADPAGKESVDNCQGPMAHTADNCAVTWPLGIIPKALVATSRTHCGDKKVSVIVGETDNLQTSDTRPGSAEQAGDSAPDPTDCGKTAVLQLLESANINEFISAVGKLASPLWQAAELPPFSLINLFPPETEIALQNADRGVLKTQEWLDLATVDSLPAGGKLLSVFLMDEHARQVLPIHYYNESNKPPSSYTLAHRDYFRRVRDRAGLNVLLRPSSAGANEDPLALIPCEGANTEGKTAAPGRCIQQNNLYIQRLLNINTGTRGTTLGIPLNATSHNAGGEFGAGYILGADIVLPSLSLAGSHQPQVLQDMVVMVVDRVSGQVLYHLDRKRAMVENLYQAGRGTAGISRSIRAGRLGNKAIAGYYHGEPGDFLAGSLPVGKWAVVVFIPDNSAGSLMTNTFLASTGVMGIAMLLLATFLAALRRFRDTDELKARWRLPLAINRHALMFFGSILVASVCFADTLGRIIGRVSGESLPVPLGLVAALVLFAGAGTLLVRQRRRFTPAATDEQNSDNADARTEGEETVSRNGAVILLLVYVALTACVTLHLSLVGDKPSGALNWYYKNLYQARLNQEQRELSEIALTRYPNTIKQHAREPLTLVPISQQWRDKLNAPCVRARSASGPTTRDRQWDVKPEHIGSFSQYTWSATPYDWVLRYLFGVTQDNGDETCRFSLQYEATQTGNRERDASEDQQKPAAGEEDHRPQDPKTGSEHNNDRDLKEASDPDLGRFTLAMTAAFLLLCWLWLLFYRRVIGHQLAGSAGLLTHLRHIVNRNVPERTYAPRPNLVLDLHCERACGEDLASLLLRHRNIQPAAERATDSPEQREKKHLNRRGAALLLSECEWLHPGPEQPDTLPGVKIRFAAMDDATAERAGVSAAIDLLGVQLSHLDVCLSRADSRRCLLALVRHLKAMALADECSELRINLGFHSYEALLLKAHNMESDRDPISESERASWAETLMDFTVELPDELTSKLNPAFVKYECEGSHLLQGLPGELLDSDDLPAASWTQRRRWLLLDDIDKSGREWASINSILLKAGALFRHKWETCSSAEKLALFYLARNKRINAANAQLLEQLALQGLIRIDHDRVKILNNSFAYFARHAEDTATLKELVEIGEVGAWKEYRLPVTLVILLVLGGIALTSGSSIYLIVASLLGLLGTIGSLTSSAQMIRENLR